MPRARTLALTALAMCAFAANSLLCREALKSTGINPGVFTALRIVSGAAVLLLILLLRRQRVTGNWGSALALFTYAIAFSLAYLNLTAATGALLLFGAVQVTMVSLGVARGERLTTWQIPGLALAACGLIVLLLPGLARPPLGSALLMLAGGVAWAIYSLRGRGSPDPTVVTAGNFLRAAPLACAAGAALATLQPGPVPTLGVLYAGLSGAVTSGLGYVIWYAALRGLRSTEAAVVQLSVPVLAAAGGVLLLGEHLTPRLLLCALATIGGIALVVAFPKAAHRSA